MPVPPENNFSGFKSCIKYQVYKNKEELTTRLLTDIRCFSANQTLHTISVTLPQELLYKTRPPPLLDFNVTLGSVTM